MGYRSIDASLVVITLHKLQLRIKERFPNAGLAAVCAELSGIATDTKEKVERLARPILLLRLGIFAILVSGPSLAVFGLQVLSLENHTKEIFSFAAGLESIVNLILVIGTGVFLLANLETRIKRHHALKALHELRSIIHVIDMHQLTKDPAVLGGPRTDASPDHSLTPFELVRYLDYCSEMLSLSGKLAALYAQGLDDRDIIEAASDIEQLATNLSQKVWQKITIVQR
jgi:hypothetical protein